MRLPIAAHTQRPWRIHREAPQFAVLDVWSCRAPGAGPDDFATYLELIRSARQPLPVRALFAARWKLGDLFGWDGDGVGFTEMYRQHDEAALEIVNRTVHGIMHLGWVRVRDGEYQLRMAVLVKPNGTAGRAYLAAIAPFRYLIVYPVMLRSWERAWRERMAARVN